MQFSLCPLHVLSLSLRSINSPQLSRVKHSSNYVLFSRGQMKFYSFYTS